MLAGTNINIVCIIIMESLQMKCYRRPNCLPNSFTRQ